MNYPSHQQLEKLPFHTRYDKLVERLSHKERTEMDRIINESARIMEANVDSKYLTAGDYQLDATLVMMNYEKRLRKNGSEN